MAAPTIAQIMAGIEVRLQTISGLRTAPYIAELINPPMAIIEAPHTIDYHSTFGRGKVVYDIRVTVLVSKIVDRMGMAELTAYADVAGAKSIITAVEGDKTLGGLVDDCIIRNGFQMLTKDQADGLGFFGGVWDLGIIAQGS